MLATYGIFGGTFDPIHIGHLRSALEVKSALALDSLYLLPCHIPPHRRAPGGTPLQRLAMINNAIKGSDLMVDSRELDRNTQSYSIDTISSLREEIGCQSSLCFILGADAFLNFDTWHRWQEMLSLCHMVLLQRPGYDMALSEKPVLSALLQEHKAHSAGEVRTLPAGKIFSLALTQLDVSASKIRRAISQGESVRYLVPDSVFNYIERHSLYKTGDINVR